MTALLGAALDRLDDQACQTIIEATLQARLEQPPSGPGEDAVLLAHCTDGVVWGHAQATGWKLSHQPFPGTSPQLSSENLLELRLFSRDAETYLWRTTAGWRGRRLADADLDDLPAWAHPLDGQYLLLGDRLLGEPEAGFSLIGDAAGARQAVPRDCTAQDLPLQLDFRCYLARDPTGGTVRVHARRLCALRPGEAR